MKQPVFIVKTFEYPQGIVCPELASVQALLEDEADCLDDVTIETEVTIIILRMTQEEIDALPEAEA